MLGCGSGLGDAGATDIGDIFDDLGDAISDAGDWISTNAPGVLSVVGGVVGSVVLPGVGTAAGSALGGAIGKGVKAEFGPSSGGQSVSPTPVVNPLTPFPGIENLYPMGFGGSYRGNNGGPITIHEDGWILDPAGAKWVKGQRSISAKAGDRNTVTGATYPPSSTQGVAMSSIFRALANNPAIQAAAAKARGQQYQSINLAAPLEPAPAKTWSTTQKVSAGVGAAGLAYLVWRLAK